MPDQFVVEVEDNFQKVYSEEFAEALELGRQRHGEDGPYSLNRNDSTLRLVIAAHTETTVGRRQVLVEPQVGDRIKLTNCSSHAAIAIEGQAGLDPNATRVIALPVTLQCGQKRISVEHLFEEGSNLNSLSSPQFLPGASMMEMSGSFQDSESSMRINRTMSPMELFETGGFEPLIRSLEFAIDILQSAKTKDEFFSRATQAIVNVVGLDTGRALAYNRVGWETQAVYTSPKYVSESTLMPSGHILNEVLRHKKVFWQEGPTDLEAESLMGVQSIVAAPILDEHGEVIGALYGDNRLSSATASRALTKLDAMLVELLSCGVASGLARLKQQQAADSLRVQFAQFFTKQLAEELEKDETLLEGRDADVSVLFCDIRNFSRLCEGLGTAKTFEWINDVMSALTECITENNGVPVNYIGDEVMAMWGAPVKQDDHAILACRAGIAMLRRLPELNRRWQSTLNAPIDVGIGINSGPVQAGNTGSRQKFNYGALGHTVNLASRVQGATKYLRTRLIVTGSTFDALSQEFSTRRLCNVRVVNIQQPVPLYEVNDPTNKSIHRLLEEYESSLNYFETGHFRKAAGVLGSVMNDFREDAPSLLLLSRTVNAMVQGDEDFDPVWELPGK